MSKKNRNNRLNRRRKPRFLTNKNPASELGGIEQGSSVTITPDGAGVRIRFSLRDQADIDAFLMLMLDAPPVGEISYE